MADRLIDQLDRAVSQAQHPLQGLFSGLLGNLLYRTQQQAHVEPPPPGPRSRPSPRPPPPPRQPDPIARAREILGFEPTDKLTQELVQKRRQALARVFHPDMPGGSEAQMKRINQAADLLLAKIS